MPFFSWKKSLSNLASQSTQQPQPVCTWSAHALQSGSSPPPFPRHSHTLTTTTAGKLFLFGGDVHDRASSDLYVVSTRDFSTTLLQTSGDVPTPRFAHCAALIGTTLLICGGKTGSSVSANVPNHDSLYLLNLESREWSRVVVDGPGPGGCFDHTTMVVGSKLFVFSGVIGGTVFNDMWTLDLNCLKSQPLWELCETPGDKKPLPRSGHVSITTEDRIIIFGGANSEQFFNDTWSFDISTRKWTRLQCTGSIPSPRYSHAAVLVDDVMYVFAGFSKDEGSLDDLYALQLSTQRWFKFHNEGLSPHRRANHAMASDGTRVFVLGGYSKRSRSDETSLIHVFDTKDIKYPDPERNVVNPNEKTTLLAQKPSPGPPTQEQPQHQKSFSSEARGASHLQNAIPAKSGHPATLQIIHERNPGPNGQPLELTGVNSNPRRDPEDDVSEGSTEYIAKFGASHSSSGEETRLEFERQLSVSLAAQTERDQRIARLTDELALKSALLEQAEANAVEAARRAGSELREYVDDQRLKWTSLVKERDVELVDMQVMLRDTQARLDELLLSRDQQIGQHERELTNVRAKLEANESELEAVRLRLVDAEKDRTSFDELVVSRDRQVGQYENELTNMRAKLEANESELEVVRLRLVDAEKDRTSLDELVLSRDQQVGQYEKELENVRAKLEANESELEAVRLRLTDAEKGLTKSKAEADTLRSQTATGSMNRDEDQVTHRLMERVRAIEAEIASKRWNEKSIEEMECRNEG